MAPIVSRHLTPVGVAGATRRRRATRLATEIAAVLVIKVIVLWLIWWAWFSEPVARHMQVDPAVIERRILDARSE